MLNKLIKGNQKNGNAMGTFLGGSTPAIVEILGYTGIDFVVIDTEHGPYDTMPVSDLIKAAEGRGMAPVVKVADVTHKEIQRAVDNGAEGIIIPFDAVANSIDTIMFKKVYKEMVEAVRS